MKGRRIFVLALAAVALGGSFAVGFELRERSLPQAAPPAAPAPLRTEVLHDLRAYYYQAVPVAALHAATVKGMLRALADPYTRYLPPNAYSQLQAAETGSYPGVGLALAREQRGLRVTASFPGFPGRQAGIRPGDVITTIDGTSLASLSYRRALNLIGGRAGTQMHLRIVRQGRDHPLSLTLVRRHIGLPYVSSRVVAFGGLRVCVIKLLGFPATAGARVRALAGRAHRRHEAVILDLRGNPGGLLSQAVAVVRVFARSGVVMRTQGLHEPPRQFFADNTAVGRMRIAVLINGGTASAAEVVAGALHADAGAVIVGRRSYGKGTVQAVEPLAGGGALKLTVARYTLRGGLVVEGRGIQPTLPVDVRPGPTDRVLLTALRALSR